MRSEQSKETLACLIIDDLPLRPRYGFLEYGRLLEEMKIHNFFTEIAFIPWNYRRSSPETVRLLLDNPNYFALCVHGCNHTYNEFGGVNYPELMALSSTALWRMEQHKRISGLKYDPVIVFPQDLFSTVAISAIKNTGYDAAFCTTLQATDTGEPPKNEFQQPATNIYHDFPVFLRRYPFDKSHFLRDVEWNRPILIVKHNHDFKRGYNEVLDLIDWVNSLGNIRWTSLSGIVEHYTGSNAHIQSKSTNMLQSNLIADSKVAVRRYLCEARDNYVDKSNLLTKVYNSFRRLNHRSH